MAVIAVGVIGAAVASSATAGLVSAGLSSVVAGVVVAGVQTAAGVAASMIDAELFGTRADQVKTQGPRLSELTTQTAAYGSPLPAVWGSLKVGGALIWAPPIDEENRVSESRGGKKKRSGGGTSSTTYTYYGSAAVAFSSRPIDGVSRILANGKVIADLTTASAFESDGRESVSYAYAPDGTPISATISGGKASRITVYFGTEYQEPDPLIAEKEGIENTPAYRGTAYAVIERLPLAEFGNAIPTFNFVVSAGEAESDWKALKSAVCDINPIGTDSAVPVAINFAGRQWATFGIDGDGRIAARTYRLNRRRTAAELVDSISGPMPMAEGIHRLDSLLDPTGRFVAVLLRGAGSPYSDGWLQLTVFDVWRNSFIGSDLMPVPGMSSLGGDAPMWSGDRIVSPSASTIGLGVRSYYGWRVTSAGGVDRGIQFYLPLGYGSIAGFRSYTDAVACNASVDSTFYLSSFGGSSTGVGIVRPLGTGGVPAAIGPVLFTGRSLGGISSRGRAERLPSGEWLVIHEGQGEGAPGWIATISSDGESVTRDAFDLNSGAGCPVGRVSISYLKTKNRIGIFGFQGSDVSRYAEVEITASGFEVRRSSAPLPGEVIPGSGITGYRSYYADAALPGILLCWPAHSGVVQPVRCYDPEPDILVSDIMSDLCRDAEFDEADFDFSDIDVRCRGFSVPRPMAARACFEQLNTYASCDVHRSDAQLRAVPRSGTPIISIPNEHTGMLKTDGSDGKAALQLTRPADLDLPRSLTVTYIDQDADYDPGAQSAGRAEGATGGVSDASVELAIAMSGSRARGIAAERLFAAYNERDKVEGAILSDYLFLDAGDVIEYRGLVLRLLNIRTGGNGIEFTACRASELRPGYELEAPLPPERPLPAPPPLPSEIRVLDLPLMNAAQDEPSIVAAVVYPGAEQAFPGAYVYRGYEPDALLEGPLARRSAVVGTTLNALGFGPARYWDEVSFIDVALSERDAARLETVTRGDVLNGFNFARVGSEILQFRRVDIIDVGRVRLSDLRRGRRGTERFIGSHIAGEEFVLLSPDDLVVVPLEIASNGKLVYFSAVTVGLNVENAARASCSANLESLRPFAPCHLDGIRDASGGVAISWKRRSRTESRWLDWSPTPLDEAVERYRIEILNTAGDVVRSVVVNGTSSFDYSASSQMADFGALQSALRVRVAQFSGRVGWGHPAEADI